MTEYKMLVYHIAVFTKSHISSLTHIKGPQIWGSRVFFFVVGTNHPTWVLTSSMCANCTVINVVSRNIPYYSFIFWVAEKADRHWQDRLSVQSNLPKNIQHLQNPLKKQTIIHNNNILNSNNSNNNKGISAHASPYSQRDATVIQFHLSPQWREG